MKIEVLKEQNVPLLNRKRISLMADFDGGATPSIIQFKDAIALQLKIKPELVSVRHVYQRFGSSHAKVIAHIYQTREELLKSERIKKAERKLQDKAKADAEAKTKAEAEAKKAEEKTAEVKEVVKEEKPTEETKEVKVEQDGEEAKKE